MLQPIRLALTLSFLMLPSLSSALVILVNEQDLLYDEAPMVRYQAGERVLMIDSDGDYLCGHGSPPAPTGQAATLRLHIDGADAEIQGNVGLSFVDSLPVLALTTAAGPINCTKNRIFRDRFTMTTLF